MKAIVQNGYGSPDVLAFKDVAKPAIKDDQVLVRVHAISINAIQPDVGPWALQRAIQARLDAHV